MRMGSTPGASLAALLGSAVRVGTVRVGEIAGVFLDGSRVIGLEVAGPAGARRFLPWIAAGFDGSAVRVDSALLLVDAVDSYEQNGARPVRDASVLAELAVSAEDRAERFSAAASLGTDVE